MILNFLELCNSAKFKSDKVVAFTAYQLTKILGVFFCKGAFLGICWVLLLCSSCTRNKFMLFHSSAEIDIEDVESGGAK